MNGRRIFREYAQSRGLEAKEFVEIKQEWYENDILVTKDNSGQIEKTSVNYKEMVHWMIKKK
jgi:cytidylate kinase